MLLRRAGTVTNAAPGNSPGSAAHHAAKCGVLRMHPGTRTEPLRQGVRLPTDRAFPNVLATTKSMQGENHRDPIIVSPPRIVRRRSAFHRRPAAAQQLRPDWRPTETVRLIVPAAAGGSTDVMGRLLAAHLQANWGQSAVVENRSGGGGTIGTSEACARRATATPSWSAIPAPMPSPTASSAT